MASNRDSWVELAKFIGIWILIIALIVGLYKLIGSLDDVSSPIQEDSIEEPYDGFVGWWDL